MKLIDYIKGLRKAILSREWNRMEKTIENSVRQGILPNKSQLLPVAKWL